MQEVLASDYSVALLCGTEVFLRGCRHADRAREVVETSEKQLSALGSVETNNAALAVVRMKPATEPRITADTFSLVLDDIRDPGNLGTIIRTADWYGIRQVVASEETADVYNPKVINATMGSFLRVSVHYVALENFLSTVKVPVYGTFLEGEDIHRVPFGKGGLLVIGNESRGISPGVSRLVTKKVTIPRYGQAESLNASVATAVLLDNLKRSGSPG